MDDALTLPELRVLAAVLAALEHLDPDGARINAYAADVIEKVRVLPIVEPGAPYREQAAPTVALDADTWAEQRRAAAQNDERLQTIIRTVERDDARAVIFAMAYDAAVHCSITPGEVSILSLLEREWNLAVQDDEHSFE